MKYILNYEAARQVWSLWTQSFGNRMYLKTISIWFNYMAELVLMMQYLAYK